MLEDCFTDLLLYFFARIKLLEEGLLLYQAGLAVASLPVFLLFYDAHVGLGSSCKLQWGLSYGVSELLFFDVVCSFMVSVPFLMYTTMKSAALLGTWTMCIGLAWRGAPLSCLCSCKRPPAGCLLLLLPLCRLSCCFSGQYEPLDSQGFL